MKRPMLNLTVFSIFLVLLILLPTSQNFVLAEENMAKDECFVDLDGDGFNDNSYDFENDKYLEKNNLSTKEAESITEKNTETDISIDFGENTNVSSSLSKSERFRLVKISVKGQDNCRGESDSNFGGNMGGVGGSGQAGGCAGGVCVAN